MAKPASTPLVFHLLLLLFHGHCSSSSPIKTVVVIVMENRSFDHMLGWMKRLNPEIDGADGTQSNPLNVSDPASPRIPFTDGAEFVDPDPGHSFQAMRHQIFGSDAASAARPPPMNGFAEQACSMNCTTMPRAVMRGFDPDQVPVYRALVSEFAVFDRWFASVPASTQPNRLFVHSATSGGATSNIPRLLVAGYPQRTLFDSLDDDGVPFGIYYQNIPATLFYRNLRKLKHLARFRPYDLLFRRHAREGRLPGYVVVEQRYMDSKLIPANDDHPSHDVYEGQRFVKEVYEALRAGPQWNTTLLLITYDEHGGFYDHVPTPVRGVPTPDGIVGPEPFMFRFDRLGVRVPTIAVSPWIRRGTVVHGPEGKPFPSSEFEHSSIPATVKKIFNLSSPFLTRRDAWAGTFEDILLTMPEPRTDCPVELPEPVRIRRGEANEEAGLSEFQQEMLQLAAVLKGDHVLASYPNGMAKGMSVKAAKAYMEGAVERLLEAGRVARKMGVDGERVVTMRPAFTTAPTRAPDPAQRDPDP